MWLFEIDWKLIFLKIDKGFLLIFLHTMCNEIFTPGDDRFPQGLTICF